MEYKNKVFTKEELKSITVEDATFIHCIFAGAYLRFSSFLRCTFTECDFSQVMFDMTNFTSCTFKESKLSYLDFSEVALKTCKFSHARMVGCVFHTFKSGAKNIPAQCDLRSCMFEESDLSETVFIRCNCSKVNFRYTNLSHVVFEKCDLTEADMNGATVSGTNFELSKIDRTILNIDGFITYGVSKGFVVGV